ncbi:MAG TPA: hypothetical protein VN282_07525 [Pyrinomonadaceae bacterium]|nr:hypothetical protein [Pyrinomonadaceae bacterium]
MRKTLGVCLLVLSLTGPASAGIIQNDKPAPPPQPATAAQEPTGGGTATDETPAGTADVLTQIVSDVLAVLPSLF